MKDEWVTTALSDDSVVVELLFRLKQSSSESPAKPPPVNSLLYLYNGWGHRQPRSKPPPPTTTSAGKKLDSATTTSTTRFSPTTPLSWSGGDASPSDDAYEDCSHSSRLSFDPSRSKISYANEAATLSCKRSRKKKTWADCADRADLKEEESFLLKERVNLTKELASMQVTIKEQKARGENLKRIKLDFNNVQRLGEAPKRSNRMEVSTSGAPADPSKELSRNATPEGSGSSSSAGVEKEVPEMAQQRGFILPDLNMTPSEEENTFAPGILYGIN